MSAMKNSNAAPAGANPREERRFAGAMRVVRLIATREIAATFDSSVAYVYAIAFILLANSIFMNDFFLAGTVDMTAFFERMPLLLAIFMPAITMRSWAEERKSRTIEWLLTLPIQPVHAVIGKFIAATALLVLFIVGTLPIPIMLMALGDPDLGQIFTGYVGLVMLGCLFLSLGMAASSLTSDQIVAFVTTTLLCFLFVLTGHERVVPVLDGLWPSLSTGTVLYEHVSVLRPYQQFMRGVIDAGAVLYFGLMSAVFLWLNVQALHRIRT